MPVTKLIEKPNGARDVHTWDVHTQRDYRPYWWLGGSGGSGPALYDPEMVEVNISVKFYTNSGAKDFEAKVLDMMPEVNE